MTAEHTGFQNRPVDAISYRDLYARWERGNWSVAELDFTRDRIQWRSALTAEERSAAIWSYALFLAGEDSVAQNLTAFIDAAPTEEQKYFLATQQADEARHAVFFKRVLEDVCGVGDGTIASALAGIDAELTWGHRQVFRRLQRLHGELATDRSAPRLAQAIALYHVVIEATVAQPAQRFISSYLLDRDLLPALRTGLDNVARDEERHIAFGVKLLADLHRGDPEVAPAVSEILHDVLALLPPFGVPANRALRPFEVFGYTLEAILADALRSLESKLRSAGLALDTLPGPPFTLLHLPIEERARAYARLVYAGYLGERLGPSSRAPGDVALFFQTVAGAFDLDGAPPGTLQWRFSDAEPWYLEVRASGGRVCSGRAPAPTATLHCRFEDWVDIVATRTDPRRTVARGRLRASGNLLWLWRARGMFPL